MSDAPVGGRIAILLFPEVEELDAAGPWEVLASWTRQHPQDGFEVSLVSLDGAPVLAAKGMTMVPHGSLADLGTPAVFLHPGGWGTRALMRDGTHLQRMRDLRDAGVLMTSVCTGSLVYAAAGLLAHRPATTHWGSLDLLGDTDRTIEVRPDDRFVDDGDVLTSAGVSAGIDLALHLVARLAGTERAREVRRDIQYDPAPPV